MYIENIKMMIYLMKLYLLQRNTQNSLIIHYNIILYIFITISKIFSTTILLNINKMVR
jgi:hypothetical protein